MQKEKCQPQGHIWTCVQEEGMLGELKKSFPLNTDQIKRILEDNNEAQVVCPGGIIECDKCKQPLIETGDESSGPDFDDLSRRLIK